MFVYNFEKVHGRSMDTRRFVNWVLSGGVHPTKRGRDDPSNPSNSSNSSNSSDVGGQDKRIDIEDESPTYAPSPPPPTGDKHNLRRLLHHGSKHTYPTPSWILRFPNVRQHIAAHLMAPLKTQYLVALDMLPPTCEEEFNLTPSNVTCETLKECGVICDENGNVEAMNKVYHIPTYVDLLHKLRVIHMDMESPFQELPSSFYKLTNLEDCTMNQINGQISPEIENMTKLDRFQIIGGNITSLPDTLWTMQSLRVLSIVNRNETQMTRPIPETIDMPKLSFLQLGSCGLPGEIPIALGNQPNLRAILLRNNNLEGDVTWLQDTNIHTYDLEGNPNLRGVLFW